MALKSLSGPTMLAVSKPWLDPRGRRPAIEKLEVARAVLPVIERAHAELQRALEAGDAGGSKKLESIEHEAAEVDRLHDRKLRGIFYVLTGHIELADDQAEASRYLALRDQLFPAALKATGRSHLDEARDVAQVDGRLSAESRSLLASMPIAGGKLAGSVEEWKAAGAKLGELEAGAADLRAATAGAGATSAVATAREAWTRAVRAFIAALDLEPLDEPTLGAILAPLRAAEIEAEGRSGQATSG